MRAREENMVTFFIAWGYEVSYLEFIAALTSFVGVWYGTTTKRVTWPWWIISSALYGIFFWQVDLIASALLQIVFILAGIWGWFGWGPSGAKPRKLTQRDRALCIAVLILSWLIFTPWLHSIGAAAYKTDALIFLGSVLAQILMVYEKYESWPLWLAVDALATVEYAVLKYWFTALLYLAFTVIAVIGWQRWLRIHKSFL
jgi:nicotinamide mononucleotide transporter